MIFRAFCVVFFCFFSCLYADYSIETVGKTHDVALKVLQILEEQPDSIEKWEEDRIYLAPEKIEMNAWGAILHNSQSEIHLPRLSSDNKGVFLLCRNENLSKEAQEHYDRAKGALVEALEHSVNAGLWIEMCPPLSVYEGYKAIGAWKEAAQEYNAYVHEQERENPYDGMDLSGAANRE